MAAKISLLARCADNYAFSAQKSTISPAAKSDNAASIAHVGLRRGNRTLALDKAAAQRGFDGFGEPNFRDAAGHELPQPSFFRYASVADSLRRPPAGGAALVRRGPSRGGRSPAGDNRGRHLWAARALAMSPPCSSEAPTTPSGCSAAGKPRSNARRWPRPPPAHWRSAACGHVRLVDTTSASSTSRAVEVRDQSVPGQSSPEILPRTSRITIPARIPAAAGQAVFVPKNGHHPAAGLDQPPCTEARLAEIVRPYISRIASGSAARPAPCRSSARRGRPPSAGTGRIAARRRLRSSQPGLVKLRRASPPVQAVERQFRQQGVLAEGLPNCHPEQTDIGIVLFDLLLRQGLGQPLVARPRNRSRPDRIRSLSNDA